MRQDIRARSIDRRDIKADDALRLASPPSFGEIMANRGLREDEAAAIELKFMASFPVPHQARAYATPAINVAGPLWTGVDRCATGRVARDTIRHDLFEPRIPFPVPHHKEMKQAQAEISVFTGQGTAAFIPDRPLASLLLLAAVEMRRRDHAGTRPSQLALVADQTHRLARGFAKKRTIVSFEDYFIVGMTKISDSLDKYDGISSVKTWARVVARNAMIDLYWNERNRLDGELPGTENLERYARGYPEPLLTVLLQGATPRERHAFTLYVEGHTQADIAQEVGMTQPGVSTLIARVRRDAIPFFRLMAADAGQDARSKRSRAMDAEYLQLDDPD
jgi:RNA polymerase sigma factor (sigma-70 family)